MNSAVYEALAKFNNLPWLEESTIFLAEVGSTAYGTATPQSDTDYKGLCVPPLNYFLGCMSKFEQAECKDPDLVIYDIRKFISLAADCNPSIVEVLWVDDSNIVKMTPLGEVLRENRRMFLSKKAKHTFTGYAVSQLRRIATHRRWLLNPPKEKPTRAGHDLPEFGVISPDQRMAAEAAIEKKLAEWDVDLEKLEPADRLYIRERWEQTLKEVMGITDGWLVAGRAIGYSDNFLAILDKERGYRNAMKEWEQYETWKRERNKVRAEMEARFGYDCYTADTEFLTEAGWKLYRDIDDADRLATVFLKDRFGGKEMVHRAEHLGVEYQTFTNRFEGQFTGNLHRFYGTHLETTVTPNHRMLYREFSRRNGTLVSGSMLLEEAAEVPDCFEFVVAPTPVRKTYSNPVELKGLPIGERAYMTLMGWYLADGSVEKRGGKPRGIRISQKLGGKLSRLMALFHHRHRTAARTGLYQYERKPNAFRSLAIIERVLSVRHSGLAQRIFAQCGDVKEKRIPRWVFKLSKRLMEILFDAMVGGDGTVRRHKTRDDSVIYYSSLKGLADDVQELAFLCGWETSLYGPYADEAKNKTMYQVHVRKGVPQFRRLIRSQNLEKIPVAEQPIVCFTVPNGTLITRKNGFVSIHGNSKHAMHLVRLMRECEEILTTGEVHVRRPDAAELLEIRNGAWSYEQLIEYADRMDAKLTELAKVSALPNQPDRAGIDKLCQELVGRFHNLGLTLGS